MSELNDWFLSLPEARQAVLRDDKWFLAEAAFAAGKAARAQPAQAGQVLTDRHTLQAQGKHPAPCARFCEANAFRIKERQQARLIAELEAQVTALTLETERTARNRDMWKGQTQRQADRLHALHSCMAALRRLLARDPCAHASTAVQMIDAANAPQPNGQAEGEPPCSPS